MEFDMLEIWKDIPGYEGLYMASQLGNIKSLKFSKSRALKGWVGGHGYRNDELRKDGKSEKKRTHQFIAMAWLNHTPCGYESVIDHINNNRLDNRVCNLQVTTARENVSKDRKGGTSKLRGVSFNKHANKWAAFIWINGKSKYLGYFSLEQDAHKAYKKAVAEL